MPIYEYECTRCGDQTEAIQGFHDAPLKKCEKCGGKLHKLVSESAFHLKGSGWYVTDYSRSTRPGARKESKDGKDGKDSKEGGNGKEGKDTKESKESKPAAESKGAKESQSTKSASA
ncbi:MAG TPA: zinc ribbon domain-containing protein [Myxococcota bacterium]|nr:zinc ribbon domain-containing protein [Myxococcota bacterium]HRY96833.1 zinc ribbon domain-containing protein [Myxococcota bacterium]HSA21681.1 zinc ribbon domain-containing protein [Myxococcota bacterium]